MGNQVKMISGVGAGEGPAAMRGHQSGVEWAAVAMPTLSREIETLIAVSIRFPASTPPFS